MLLFNFVTNDSKRRRCGISIAPGVNPGLDGDIVIISRGDGVKQRMDGCRGDGVLGIG